MQVTSSTNANTFQWQTGSPWTDIPGATNTSLTRQGADLAVNTNDFNLVAKNSIGCAASFASSVTVLPQPAIVTGGQPVDATICGGANTAFEVTATGGSLTYQWQVDAGSGFSDILNGGLYTGATTARLQLTGATVAVDGYRYRAQIKTVIGGTTYCSVVLSDAAVLTLDSGPSIAAGGQPANTAICPNGSATFRVTASGVGLTYQWQEDAGSGFTNVVDGAGYAGATTATLSVLNVPGTSTGRRYRVLIQGTRCGSVMSDGAATLSVTQGITISGQPASAVVCPGSAAGFQVSVTNASGLTYQWQEDDGSGFRDVADGNTYSGVTSSTLAINTVTSAMNARRYRVMIQRPGCASVSSDGTAMLTVRNAPVIARPPQDLSLCFGESGSMTVAAGGPAAAYHWQVDDGRGFRDIGDGGVYGGARSETLTLLEPPVSMDGYGLRVALRWSCGDVMSTPAVLSVNPPPVVSAGPDQEIEQHGSVVLEGGVPAGVTNFTWVELADTPQGNVLQPTVAPETDTRYTLSATDNNGCTATDEVVVIVTPLFNIPNAFSPNHDGVNDTWEINGLEAFPGARIKVFNRYGAAVFASEHQPVSWDGSCQGKALPWGTYYYTIDLQNGEKPVSGWVLILD
jgi:gliding motility-associated-like protein